MTGRPKGRDPNVGKAGSGVDEEGRWSPVFQGQREPFGVGNEARLTHGSYQPPSRMGQRPFEIAAAVRPHLPAYSPAFEPLVIGYAVALTRAERAAIALAAVDERLDRGEAVDTHERLQKDLRQWLTTVLRFASELGLSPSSAARIARDVGIGAQAMAAHADLLAKYRGAA